MATEGRFRYLYLALACFVGLVTTYFVDGYMGIYDTLYITAGEREQKIELYHWLKGGGAWTGGAEWGEKAFFSYEIDNRKFLSLSTDIEISLGHNQEKVRDLVPQRLEIAPFNAAKLEWLLDTLELEPGGTPPLIQPYKYSVVVKSDKTERELNFYIYTPPPSVQEFG